MRVTLAQMQVGRVYTGLHGSGPASDLRFISQCVIVLGLRFK
jgi:hypothetical protein